MVIKNEPMRTKTVPIERFHLVQKLDSFLDIPKGVLLKAYLSSSALPPDTVSGHYSERGQVGLIPPQIERVAGQSTLMTSSGCQLRPVIFNFPQWGQLNTGWHACPRNDQDFPTIGGKVLAPSPASLSKQSQSVKTNTLAINSGRVMSACDADILRAKGNAHTVTYLLDNGYPTVVSLAGVSPPPILEVPDEY